MPSGVIFDMDGVLVDSGPPHLMSWQLLARQQGIDISPESFQRCFGRPSRDIIRIIWGSHVTDAEIQRLDDEKERLYRKLIADAVPLMPGCGELLAHLRAAGFVLAVATSGPRENLALVLKAGGIGEFFTATVNGFDIAHGKPAPDCFRLAAERIGVPAGDCVVVEDAPVGVQAGVAAGMKVIALAGAHPPEALVQAGAAVAVLRLAEITAALIERLVERTD
jgi:beta-phosphoglucomutase